MATLENVINGLECWVKSATAVQECDGDCPYRTTVEEQQVMGECNWPNLFRDALELLKARQPRVMTLEEVRSLKRGEVAWLEELDESGNCYIQPMMSTSGGSGFFRGVTIDVNVNTMNMSKRRFWTSQPTLKQTRAVKWHDE